MNSLHTQLSECRSVLARERDALNAARANVDTLRTENARLRAALERLGNALTEEIDVVDDLPACDRASRLEAIQVAARAALTR